MLSPFIFLYFLYTLHKNVISRKHKHNFDNYLNKMNELGYNNYYEVLNAKDFCIPQRRERIFVVSIRKDLDNGTFKFPAPSPLKLRLRDILEESVDKKFYLSNRMIDYIVADNEKWTGNSKESLINKKIASTLNTGEGSRRCDASNYISNIISDDNVDLKPIVRQLKNNEQRCLNSKVNGKQPSLQNRVYDSNYISPAVTTSDMPYIKTGIDIPIRNCIKTMQGSWRQPYIVQNHDIKSLGIRKLTPLECWRLMGFGDHDFYKAQEVNSNSQLYKQAGNSIVVNVLQAIIKNINILH